MFGLSFSELVVIGVVTLLAVGPNKLPGMLRSLGQWARKARIFATDLRRQSGIDDVLRSEGLHQSINELRGIGGARAPFVPPYVPSAAMPTRPQDDPYANVEHDPTREYPPEGPDAYQALPDDLVDDEPAPAVEASAAQVAATVTAEATPAGSEPLAGDDKKVEEPAPVAAMDR